LGLLKYEIGINLVIKIPPIIRITEASAWTKKYLIEASELDGEGYSIIIGMNTIKLISNLNHAISQEDDEVAISVLKIRINVSFQ